MRRIVVHLTPYRLLAAAFVAAFIVASSPAPALAQQVTVTVNGQPLSLNPGPIERAGRVFVPLRGIFERLGAGVVYSAGTINATKGSTTVSLHIGSTQATVNGQMQYLDVAPFIVGATTYVPLRFIAQSLGANVGYDNSTRVVAIESARAVAAAGSHRPRVRRRADAADIRLRPYACAHSSRRPIVRPPIVSPLSQLNLRGTSTPAACAFGSTARIGRCKAAYRPRASPLSRPHR